MPAERSLFSAVSPFTFVSFTFTVKPFTDYLYKFHN